MKNYTKYGIQKFSAIVIFLVFATTSVFGQNVNVTASGGTLTGSYPTLKGAFDAINAGTHTGAIILDIVANLNEGTSKDSLVGSGDGAASYSSILIRPSGGAARTIFGATPAGSPLIEFNGSDNVTIDGLNTGGNSLTIENTTVSATSGTSTIRFLTDATNNLITNCTINGASTTPTTTNGGTIWFSAGAITTGNDNNTISNCNIGPSGTNFPSKAIYGNGTSATLNNSNITITNCNIYDYFLQGTHAGMYISGGNSDWVISNNKFYQTNTRSATTAAVATAIQVSNSSAENMQITGNTIGFANSTGTGLTAYSTGSATIAFRVILMSVSTNGVPSVVSGNTISGISLSTTATGTTTTSIFLGVLVSGGLVDVTGNTFGSLTGSSGISITANNTSTSVEAYCVYNSGSDSTSISNNSVGNITVGNSGTGSMKLYVFRANTSATGPALNNISNNIIGSTSGPITNTNAAATSFISGIQSNLGKALISGNTIRNLSVSSANVNTSTTASIVAIYNSATATNTAPIITGNTIHSLSNSHASAAISIIGILNTGANPFLDVASVSRNLIHTLTSPSTAATIFGINVIGGAANYSNNMIRLGTASATAMKIYGIQETGSGTNNYYFNTIYIGNTGVGSTASNTFAFQNLTTSTSSRAIQNNIFFNARSNSTTGGKHYAINIAGIAPNPTGLTINYNLYRTTGTGGVFGLYNSADVANLGAWQTAVGQDANSIITNPCLSNPDGIGTLANLHLTNCAGAGSPAEGTGIAIAAITDDFDGETRSGLTPTDIGADAGLYGQAGKDVGVTALIRPTAVTCHSGAEDVVITLTNFSDPIDFSVDNVTLSVNITGAITGTFSTTLTSGTMASGASQNYTLGQINTTANGTYTFVSSASMTSDINNGNNTLNSNVVINYTLPSVSASASLSSICGGNSTVLTAAPLNGTTPYSYNWSPSGGTGITATVSPTTNTTYTVTLTDACGVTASGTVSISVDNQTVATTTAGSRCGTGTVVLGATPGGSATLRWYANATGGSVLSTNTSFTTPVISVTDTFYVSARGPESTSTGARLAPATNTTTTGTFGLIFDASQNFEIDSVDIYPASASGSITVELRDALNTTLDSRTIAITGGSATVAFRIPLHFAVNQGTGYRLVALTGHPGMVREASLGGFPYSLGANGSITGSTSGTNYYWFYNWKMTQACESPRVPVIATVTPAPVVTTTISPNDTVCQGTSISLTANSSNNDYTYTWSYNGTTTSGTGTVFNFMPSQDTTVYMRAEDQNSLSPNFGCVFLDTNTFVVNDSITTPIISPTNPSICPGGSTTLTVTNPANTLVTASVGPATNGQATGYTLEAGIFFTATSSFTMKGAYIYPVGTGAGVVNIELQTAAGATLQSVTFNGTGTTAPGIKTFVPLNFAIVPGNYSLYVTSMSGGITTLIRDGSAQIVGGPIASNPSMTAPGMMTITSGRCCSGVTTSTSYYYFYDIQLESGTAATYSWNPGGATTTAITVSPAVTTAYTVTGTNSAGCTASASVTVNVSDVQNTNNSVTNLTCNGGSNGSITVTATGSLTPFQYSINGGTNYQSSNVFSGLTAGTYTVKVKDASNCTTAGQIVTLTETSAITFSTNIGNVTCFGGTDGTISVSGEAGGNGGPYEYSINNGTSYQVSNTFSGLSAGTYQVRVKDASGCESPASAVVVGTTPTTNYTITATAAAGGTITPNGAVSVQCGADQSFTITPSLCNQIDSVVVDGINIGAVSTYTFNSVMTNHTIDAYFSLITYSITATSGTGGTISPSGISTINCGSNITYTFTPDPGNIVDSITVDGINIGSPTTYTFTNVTANHTIDATFTTCTTPAIADAGADAAVCAGQNFTLAGSISGTATTGTWSTNGTGSFSPNNNVATATSYIPSAADIAAGSVVLTLTTDNPPGSCPAASDAMLLTINANPSATITGQLEICINGSTILTANATAGSGTISGYQWSLNGTTSLGTNVTQSANAIGNYNVVVTNSNGCTGSASVNTIQVDTPSVTISGTTPICSGTSTTLTANATVANGTIISYLWSLNGTSTGITTSTISVSTAGTYTVIATSSYGCTGVSAPFALSNATGPLSGNYTINTSLPESCTNFHSFATAINALNVNGVSGNVIFDVSAGHTENAPSGGLVLNMCGLSPSLQTGSTQTLVFQKSGAGANPLITAQTGTGNADAIFVIKGADYVTVDGIDLQHNSSNTTAVQMTESGYVLTACDGTNGAQNNTIKNCNITLSKANTNVSVGIGILNLGVVVTATSGSNSFNKIYSNHITNVYTGISCVGYNHSSAPYSFYDQNNEIGAVSNGNTITNYGNGGSTTTSLAYGVYGTFNNNFNIIGNTINSNGGVTHTASIRGIHLDGAKWANINIESNTITISTATTTTNTCYAINNFSGSRFSRTDAVSNTLNINNNIIENCVYPSTGSNAMYGIWTSTASPDSLSATTVNINGNIIRNNSSATAMATGVPLVWIISQASANTMNINNNTITGNNYVGTNLAANRAIVTGFGLNELSNWVQITNVNNNIIRNNNSNTSTTTGGGTLVGIDFETYGSVIAGGTLAGTQINATGNNIGGLTQTIAQSGEFRGISGANAANVAVNISNNIVDSVSRDNMTGSFFGLRNNSTTALTCTMNGNTVSKISTKGTTTDAFVGIRSTGNAATTTVMNNNTVTNCNVLATGGIFFGIQQSSTTISNVTMSGNSLTNNIITAVTTGAFTGIINAGSTTATTLVMNNNTVSGNSHSGTGTYTLMDGGSATNYTIDNNSVINNIKSGANATMYCLRSGGGSTSVVSVTNNTINNNTMPTTSGTTSATLYGYHNISSPGVSELYENNTISNLYIDGTSTATAHNIYGLYTNTVAASNKIIRNNKIFLLSSGDGISASIYGIYNASGNTINISKNKIYDLNKGGASNAVNGIYISSGVTANIYNNYVGNLTAPFANLANAVIGIQTAGGTTTNIMYNTVRIGAITSSGAAFGTSGVFASSTPTVNLQNNIIVNLSIPVGTTGAAVAYRRSTSTLTTYGAASDRNILYAGTPSAVRLIYGEGTGTPGNPKQTISDFKSFVGPRDASSQTEDVNFISTVGSNAQFLHINTSTPTLVESGAAPITTPVNITDDYDGDLRHATNPDIGADEGTFVSTALVITSVTANPTGSCTATQHTITAVIVPGSSAIVSATLNYSFNGVAQTAIPMSNSGGNNWTAIIPAAVPGNAIVAFSVTASDASFSKTRAGINYQDQYLTGVTLAAAANPSTVCLGSSTSLNSTISLPFTNQIGTATTTTTTYPYYRLFGSSKTQMMYTAAELTAAGFTAGNITAIGFDVTSASTAMPNVTIALKNTSATSLSAFETGLTTVYTAATFTPVVGVNMHTFTTPFYWNGTSNLVVDYCFENNDAGGSSTTVRYSNPGFAATYKQYQDNAPTHCSNPAGTVSSSSTIRPNLFINGTSTLSGFTYAWSSVTTGNGLVTTSGNPVTATPTVLGPITYNVVATDANGCTLAASTSINVIDVPATPTANNSTQCGIGVPPASVSGGPGTFNWYLNSSGGSPLPGETGSSLLNYSINSTTTFYVSVFNNNCESGRVPVTATVTIPDLVSASISDDTVCVGSAITLTATQTGNNNNYIFVWTSLQSGSGIATSDTGATVAVTPTQGGTIIYTVTAYDNAQSCVITSSDTVVVIPSPVIFSATGSPDTVCAGETVTLTALTGSSAPGIANIGTQSATIGGDNGNPYRSGNGVGNHVRTQLLVLASELTAQGFGAGTISSLGFTVTAVSGSSTTDDFIIKMGHTNAAVLGTNFETSPMTTVFTAPSNTPVVGVNVHTFTTPFVWNGTSNIVIDICQLNLSGGGTTTIAVYTPGYNSNLHKASSATACTDASGTIVANKPIMRIGGTVGTTGPGTLNWVWNPGNHTGNTYIVNPTTSTTYVVTATDNSTGCTNTASVNIVVNPVPATPVASNGSHCGYGVPTAFVTGGGAQFNWYLTPTGGSPIPGEIDGTLMNYFIDTTTTFYVSEYDGTCESQRVAVTETVIEPDLVSASSNLNNVCPGTTIALSATQIGSSNTYNYEWTSASSGSGISGSVFGQSINVIPTAGGTMIYTVTATDASAGCVTTATVSVTLTAPPSITVVSAEPDTICSGTPVTLTALTGTVANSVVQLTNGTLQNANNSATNIPPYAAYYTGSRQQMLLRASDLTALGITAGNITSLAFDVVSNTSTVNYQNFTIRIAPTTLTALTTTFVSTGLTQVYTASNFTPVAGWNTHTFNTPFNWNGTSNLIVETYFSNCGLGGTTCSGTTCTGYAENVTWSQSAVMNNTTLSYVCHASYYVDATSCNIETQATASATTSVMPNMRLGVQAISTGAGNYSWVWNPGSVSGNTVTVTPTTTTTYTVTATDPATSCTSSATVSVLVNPTPSAPVTSTCPSQCGYGVPVCSVSGGVGIYRWYLTPTNGTPIPNESGSTLSNYAINSTTTFYVSDYDGTCEGPRTAVVATVVQPDSVAVTSSVATVCLGSSTTLNATQIGSNNSYVYTWTASPQSGSGISGSVSGSSIAVTPTATGTYTYSVSAYDAGTNCTYVNSVVVTVSPLPASVIAGPDLTLCSGGNVTLSASSSSFIPTLRLTELLCQGWILQGYNGFTPPYVVIPSGTTLDLWEITNLGTAPLDPAGVTFETWNSTTATAPHMTRTIPVGAALVPTGGSIFFQANTPFTDDLANNVYTFNVSSDYGSGTAIGYILKKNGVIFDAVGVNGFTFPAAAGVTSSDWSGSIPTNSGRNGSILIADDNNTASCWAVTQPSGPFTSYGTLNPGVNANLAPSGSVTWTSVPPGFTANTASATFGPVTANTQFIVHLSNGPCESTDTVNVTVLTSSPAPVITSSLDSICNSGNAILTITNGVTGSATQWQQSPTGNPGTWTDILSANQLTYNTGTLFSTNHYRVYTSCSGSADTSNAITITVISPSITGTTGGSRCGPGNVTLTVSGNGNFTWYDAATGGNLFGTGSSLTQYFGVTTTLYAEASIGSCVYNGGRQPATATIAAAPTASVVVSPGTSICTGQAVSFTASSTNSNYTYSWSADGSGTLGTGTTFNHTPDSTTTYVTTVEDTVSNSPFFGCGFLVNTTVNLFELPTTPNISASSNAICSAGDSVTLTVTNADTSIGTTAHVGPHDPSIGTFATWTSTAQWLNFSVLASTVKINSMDIFFSGTVGSAFTIIIRDATSLATVFTYSGTVTVSSSTVGQVVPVNAQLNSGNYQINFTVNPGVYRNSTGGVYPYQIPGLISITGNTFDPVYYYIFYNWEVQTGSSTAANYVWTPGNIAATSIKVAPNSTTTYTVTATNPTTQCSSSSSVLVTYNPITAPTIVANGSTTICSGSSITLDAGAGYLSYSWSDGSGIVGTSQLLTASPTSNTVYTVTVGNGNCFATASQSITVQPFTPPVLNAGEQICQGDSVTLNAGGGYTSYSWSDGSITVGSTQNYTAHTAGTYAVTVTSGNGCSGSASVVVTENPLPPPPVVTPSGPFTLCDNGSDGPITLTADTTGAGAGGSILWNDLFGASGSTYDIYGNDINISLNGNSYDFYATVVDVNGCQSISNSVHFDAISCGITLNLKVFLQGYYMGGGQMQPVLANQFVPGATSTQTDSVFIELRPQANTASIAASATAILNTDGSVSTSMAASPGDYWIVVRHRNSIETWSNGAITLPVPLYDFTTAATQAFGDNMVDALGDNKYSLYTGDVNQDDFIDIFDFPDYDLDNQNFVAFEYKATDFNGDGFVDIFDFPIYDANNQNFIFSIQP